MKTTRKILFSIALILAIVLSMPILVLPAKAQSTSAQTIILSNEYPGNALFALQNAGYNSYTVFQLLQKIVRDSNPSLGSIVPSSFLQALQNAPASSKVLTKHLSDYGDYNAIAISTDGTVQTVSYEGSSYLNAQGTLSLDTQISGVGSFRAVYASTQTPLTTFTPNNVTYNVFAILYMPSELSASSTPTNAVGTTQPTPSAPEFPAIAIIPLVAIALSALIIAKRKKLIH